MMRVSCTLVFLVLTTLVYSQKTTLLQNINPRAKELKHTLNKTGDSLILKGERTIYRVEIFNKNYAKALRVKNSNVTIALDDIPKGRFVVEATLIDKLILITLLRNESYDTEPELLIPRERIAEVSNKSKSSPLSKTFAGKKKSAIKTSPLSRVFSKKKETAIKIAAVDKNLNVKTEKPKTSKIKIAAVNKNTFNRKKETTIKIASTGKKAINVSKKLSTSNTAKNSVDKIKSTYWLVYETRNRHSSQKIMRIADQQLVDKMIEKNKLDLRTIAGKSNLLTIWEVYDVTKFMKYKKRNRNALTTKSDCFNSVPYFKTKEDKLASR